jgi:hypothetical protein
VGLAFSRQEPGAEQLSKSTGADVVLFLAISFGTGM